MFIRVLLFSLIAISLTTPALARDWYVSAAKGKGKKGTKEKPAKDLGNIIKKLKAGDVVHIAGGVYVGKGKSGADEIKVPVSIIGGYDEAFAKRDPWGATQTVLTGVNKTKNYKVSPRLNIDLNKYRAKEMPKIVIDGLIIDMSGQNRYKTPAQNQIVRKAKPATGENPTPDRGGLVVSVSKTGDFKNTWDVTVQNCVVMNSAASQGVLSVAAYKGSKVTIRNNVVAQNTGSGIYARTNYRGAENPPAFLIENNTVVFTWKYDGMTTSYSGESLKIDDDTLVTARNNVFAFADRDGVTKSGKRPLALINNIIIGNLDTDYREWSGDQRIALDNLEDEAEYLTDESGGNIAAAIKLPVSKAFAEIYGARVLIDRAKVEEKIQATNSDANTLRSILGLPVQAGTVKGPATPVWLNRLSIDDALKIGGAPYAVKGAKFGSSKP